MKRKSTILGLVMGLVMVLAITLVSACATPAEPTTPGPETAIEQMEPIKLDLLIDSVNIEANFTDRMVKEAFERIKERTDGRLDIRVLPAGGLPIAWDQWGRAVSTGELGLAVTVVSYFIGDIPLYGVVDIPYIFTTPYEQRLVWDAVEPFYKRELAKQDIEILHYRPSGSMELLLKNQVDSVMDLEGAKVRSFAKYISMMVETMKGVPVTIAWAEAYTALQRGVADGILTGTVALYQNKFHEILPYIYGVGLREPMYQIIMHKPYWDALPREVQYIVQDELWRLEVLGGLGYAEENARVFDLMLQSGAKAYVPEPPPGFYDLMREKVTKPLLAEQVEKNGALGQEIARAMERALGIQLL